MRENDVPRLLRSNEDSGIVAKDLSSNFVRYFGLAKFGTETNEAGWIIVRVHWVDGVEFAEKLTGVTWDNRTDVFPELPEALDIIRLGNGTPVDFYVDDIEIDRATGSDYDLVTYKWRGVETTTIRNNFASSSKEDVSRVYTP